MRTWVAVASLLSSIAVCSGLQPNARIPRARPCSRASRALVTLGSRKPFKGGTLKDFEAAGEAEAKYGPRRYAAVAEDAWKISVEQRELEENREISAEVYARQKAQMLTDHALLSILGLAGFWSLVSPSATASYAVGAALGGLYIFLLQRQTDSVGASTLEDARAGPPPIVVPVLMILIVAKNRDISLLPTLAGFTTNYLATFAQIVYPPDFGVSASDRPKSR